MRRRFEEEAVWWSQQRWSGFDVMGKRGSRLPKRNAIRCILFGLYSLWTIGEWRMARQNTIALLVGQILDRCRGS
ncbi:hypothetical protein HBI56_028840 [Parastagonospora nodorum]|uniref:Uncharacterized protein n=1 Tax=Phaeosphaeria nodorum (strain SN15 / ATCC MYA-4574 / FGSC 10173) TaxID=321614 RepID=A0A7U2F053_PHANO|nr:hypothetical protein HBH56_016450 [Parastagonospora nodorum]QRC95103.1 hypothetical protein JI435_028310 [Parastagonospora nodorum SN15]KAH3936741.1 hypothetical protein HBH54_018010 [Parastagonospora nodorum]KAH3953653.1 hypothetical protein HBH53_030390 [Parastagonospora nodorum]KAH3969423.1 hypothetical protein HBH51_122540 [Parastagonospora nodorum]